MMPPSAPAKSSAKMTVATMRPTSGDEPPAAAPAHSAPAVPAPSCRWPGCVSDAPGHTIWCVRRYLPLGFVSRGSHTPTSRHVSPTKLAKSYSGYFGSPLASNCTRPVTPSNATRCMASSRRPFRRISSVDVTPSRTRRSAAATTAYAASIVSATYGATASSASLSAAERCTRPGYALSSRADHSALKRWNAAPWPPRARTASMPCMACCVSTVLRDASRNVSRSSSCAASVATHVQPAPVIWAPCATLMIVNASADAADKMITLVRASRMARSASRRRSTDSTSSATSCATVSFATTSTPTAGARAAKRRAMSVA
mmetsp:Transcript_9048/g.21382  ORF Transcript_9048/g.21382 Transcript_9048/m.21382 type:complete len:316 (+) Transcript_9048:136-1083(+)